MALQETYGPRDGSDLRSHYSAVHKRLYGVVARPVVVSPPPPPPPPVRRPPFGMFLFAAHPEPSVLQNFETYEDCKYPHANWTRAHVDVGALYPCVPFILQEVARFYGVSVSEIVAGGRSRSIIGARHMAMFLARTMTVRSSTHIGGVMGGRDHSTILSAYRKIARLIRGDVVLAGQASTLRKIIMGDANGTNAG